MGEENVGLLAARANLQHGDQKLRGPPGTEGLHLEQQVNILVVC